MEEKSKKSVIGLGLVKEAGPMCLSKIMKEVWVSPKSSQEVWPLCMSVIVK